MSVSSNIKLYYNSKLIPSKNYMLDDFTTYLSSLNHLDLNNFQYQKIEIDMKVKINMDQSNLIDIHYNYASISHDDMTYYYFITDFKWIAHNTIELTLSMDTINTFRYQINSHFTDKTKITRQHKDRFVSRGYQDTYTYLTRKVDQIDEGTGSLNKFKDSFEDFTVSDATQISGNKWYLIYKSSTDEDNSGICCYLCADHSFNVQTTKFDSDWFYSIPENKVVFLKPGEYTVFQDQRINVTHTNRYIAFMRHGDNIKWQYYYGAITDQTLIAEDLYSDHTTNKYKIKISGSYYRMSSTMTDLPQSTTRGAIDSISTTAISTEQLSTVTVKTIADIDRTDSKLIKIVELPYCPTEFTVSNNIYSFSKFTYSVSEELLQIKDLNTKLHSDVNTFTIPNMITTIPTVANRKSVLKNKKYESKLYKSDYWTCKFVYDSFSKEILYENIFAQNANSNAFLSVAFYPSSNISSNMAFEFDQLQDYKELTDFDSWLICNRNNESPIYNNSYINYIRNGYNYDVKNKTQQDIYNWIGTSLQITGAAASFVAGSVVPGAQVSYAAGISLATSAIATIANNINSTVSAENNISQKLQEARAQSASVSGSDDLSLLNAYDGQKLKVAKYSVSDKMKDVLFDLFHYCGYADGRQSIPNTDSRRCFNYIQCEPVFDNEQDTIWLKYIDDVKTRFKAGVTVMHKFNNGSTTDYDFDQKYENFETWICNRS